MINYKVRFSDNKAVSASRFIGEAAAHLSIVKDGDRRLIQWLIVSGDDENDAICFANRLVNDHWYKFLSE